MNNTLFANLNRGQLSINTYRKCDAMSTDAEDLISAYTNKTDENLTAEIETADQLEFLRGIANGY